jgi:hypothetical protein
VLYAFEGSSFAGWINEVCDFRLDDSVFENALFVDVFGVRHVLNARSVHEYVRRGVPIRGEKIVASFFVGIIENA